MVDSAKRESLLRIIELQPECEDGRALVKVGEFFDGNDDLGSIGCNLTDHPGLQHFRSILESLAARDDVDEVWMQIYDLEADVHLAGMEIDSAVELGGGGVILHND